MPSRPASFRPQHQRSRAEARHDHDVRRGSARQRGYSGKWDKAAKAHLRRHPLCRYCELQGQLTAATAVDHLYPHKGDMEVFWMSCWWVSTCDPCHNGFKQSIERQGPQALDTLARDLGLPSMPGRGCLNP